MDTAAWTDEQFVSRRAEIEQRLARVTELEHKLAAQNATYTSPTTAPSAPAPPAKKPRPAPKPFDPSKYTTRLIALKFAYLGSNYNGFEHHANNTTPLPTIEEELWRALKKTRLILPTPKPGLSEDDINWEGCEYSKCGRTDRGVSAFGQVIGIRVRSNRPKPKSKKKPKLEGGAATAGEAMEGVETGPAGVEGAAEDAEEFEEEPPFDDVKDELSYCRVLNNVLPPDIRMLAWCPNPGLDFSARFNCKERRYKYFFTNPAFAPTPGAAGVYGGARGSMREGWLDVAAMREAASYLEGYHDFRNFCKVDPAKQISNFERRIFHTSVDRWNGGSGFARYAAAAPFQIPGLADADGKAVAGSSGESSVDDDNGPGLFTFNVHGSAFLWHQVRHLVAVLFLVGQGLEKPSIVRELLDVERNTTKPKYEMASDTPLVLWDCVFPADPEGHPEQSQPDSLDWIYVGDERAFKGTGGNGLEEKFGHGGLIPALWEYVPVMKKERMEPVEVINARYLERKSLDKKVIAARKEDADE
ncbi:putative pseudouridylate synthase 3 protein [Neofusicoccum parvum UCRNP2]|uniref:Putative pseudouridylate synthase 3 protein n=1 Tax=Botryosphaeria parva (strain UCR-NP2) TaxID=1287680 RepID=R1G4R0_BOTPV|nr:putative pseudouridylate synthase 3 protein [Neofusicoccum parvum UCRNP2]